MVGAGELTGFSEFAVALGGFGVLAHAVATRGDEVTAYRFVLLRAMLLNTLGVGLVVLLPVALSRWGLSDIAAVRSGAAALAALIAIGAFSVQRGTERTNPDRRYLLGVWQVRCAWTAALCSMVLSLVTALGWPLPPSLGAFQFAVLLVLGVAISQFMALVFGAGQKPVA